MFEEEIVEFLRRSYGIKEVEGKAKEVVPKEEEDIKEQKLEDWGERYWSHTVLPDSFYLYNLKKENKTKYFKYKACKAEECDIFKMRPRKLARLLTDMDILFIMRLSPNELVDYDGVSREKEYLNITYLKNKNRGLINYVSSLMKNKKTHRYFLRVMEHLRRLKNLNGLECLSKAFKSHRLEAKELSRLKAIEGDINTYFSLRQTVDSYYNKKIEFIYPFDLFLKDVEDSNLNINKEDASMRFCRLMEMLVGLQNSVYHWDENNRKESITKRFKHKYEHFFLFFISKWLNFKSTDSNFKIQRNEGMFLFL